MRKRRYRVYGSFGKFKDFISLREAKEYAKGIPSRLLIEI